MINYSRGNILMFATQLNCTKMNSGVRGQTAGYTCDQVSIYVDGRLSMVHRQMYTVKTVQILCLKGLKIKCQGKRNMKLSQKNIDVQEKLKQHTDTKHMFGIILYIIFCNLLSPLNNQYIVSIILNSLNTFLQRRLLFPILHHSTPEILYPYFCTSLIISLG